MNSQRQVLMYSLIAFSVFMISGLAFQEVAFAQLLEKQGMQLTVTADEGGTAISVSGTTSKVTPVAIKVTAPNGNFIAAQQISPDMQGKFMTDFNVGGSQWKFDGKYMITAQHGENTLYKISLPVEISGGKTSATNVSEDFLENIVFGGGGINEEVGLTIKVDAGGNTITITGKTVRTNMDVTIKVTEPVFRNVIHTTQVTPDAGGNFMTTISTGGNQWKQNGFYTITAQQGINQVYRDSAQVEIANGVVIPEFGAIAALILAVAIISIIVVSAKTRLSIIPRY